VRGGAQPKYVIYSGTDLEGPAYRVVSQCPPTPDDFISYLLAGRNFPDNIFFRATGVSMFTKWEEAEKHARSGYLGTCVAELDLADRRIYVALTNARTGHIVVWGPTRLLVERVVNCVDRGAEA
jgi:hypothetical protein